jgi:NTP pyrophosphatase (non-canonical NTP hydrolase)
MLTHEQIKNWEDSESYYQAEKDLAVMAKTPLDMVREFSSRMGQPLDEKWGLHGVQDTLRYKLIKEEFKEVGDATDKENLLKELADLVYVTYGYAATFGWDLDEAVRRVHQSNMSKLDDDGNPIYRDDGKVLKGPNYKLADLKDLV